MHLLLAFTWLASFGHPVHSATLSFLLRLGEASDRHCWCKNNRTPPLARYTYLQPCPPAAVHCSTPEERRLRGDSESADSPKHASGNELSARKPKTKQNKNGLTAETAVTHMSATLFSAKHSIDGKRTPIHLYRSSTLCLEQRVWNSLIWRGGYGGRGCVRTCHSRAMYAIRLA